MYRALQGGETSGHSALCRHCLYLLRDRPPLQEWEERVLCWLSGLSALKSVIY